MQWAKQMRFARFLLLKHWYLLCFCYFARKTNFLNRDVFFHQRHLEQDAFDTEYRSFQFFSQQDASFIWNGPVICPKGKLAGFEFSSFWLGISKTHFLFSWWRWWSRWGWKRRTGKLFGQGAPSFNYFCWNIPIWMIFWSGETKKKSYHWAPWWNSLNLYIIRGNLLNLDIHPDIHGHSL